MKRNRIRATLLKNIKLISKLNEMCLESIENRGVEMGKRRSRTQRRRGMERMGRRNKVSSLLFL